MFPGTETRAEGQERVPAGTAEEIPNQDFRLPGEGMTGALSRKGAQLDIAVWEEAQRRITEKEKKLKAKGEFRKVTVSEVIADAFGVKG
jgi:hypothetical protein